MDTLGGLLLSEGKGRKRKSGGEGTLGGGTGRKRGRRDRGPDFLEKQTNKTNYKINVKYIFKVFY